MMKSMIIATLVVAAAALVPAGDAFARGGCRGQGNGPVATACSEEIATHCKGLRHGQGAVRQCLASHRDDLSDKCKAALDSRGRRCRGR
jgi:hypothetical protein